MKKWIIVGMLLLLAAGEVTAQQRAAKRPRGARRSGWAIMGSDSTLQVDILPVYVFNRPVDLRKYRRLVDAVKKVYPLAQIAKGKLYEMEQQLLTIRGKKRQRAYIKHCYNQILEEYTPVAKRMTRTQGRVLVTVYQKKHHFSQEAGYQNNDSIRYKINPITLVENIIRNEKMEIETEYPDAHQYRKIEVHEFSPV